MREKPRLHDGGTKNWALGGETIALFRRLVREGDRTIETGTGASTLAFAEIGSIHTAISPAPDEHSRIIEQCHHRGVDASRLEFLAESSDLAFPRLVARGEVADLVVIDGKHAFPLPAVDYCYADRLLKVGGHLVLDDAPIGSVAQVGRFLERSPCWERVACTDDRTLTYRKTGESPDHDDWRAQRMNHPYPDFWFLPVVRRTYLTARALGSFIKRRLLGWYS